MTNKICSKCHKSKDLENEFYLSSGNYRSECKNCTIKKNMKYQRKVKSWKFRSIDNDSTRTYMREYYSKNKEKFARYRAEFKLRHPDYYKEYRQKIKANK